MKKISTIERPISVQGPAKGHPHAEIHASGTGRTHRRFRLARGAWRVQKKRDGDKAREGKGGCAISRESSRTRAAQHANETGARQPVCNAACDARRARTLQQRLAERSAVYHTNHAQLTVRDVRAGIWAMKHKR